MNERPADDRGWIVTCLINTATDFRTITVDQTALAYDYALVLSVEADDADRAAEAAWIIGNREAADTDGKQWPAHIRSLSVGDVLQIRGWTADEAVDLVVAPLGFVAITLGDDRHWNRPGGLAKMVATGHARKEA